MASQQHKTLKKVVSILLKLDLILLIILIISSFFVPKPSIENITPPSIIKITPPSESVIGSDSYAMYFFIFLLGLLFAVLSFLVGIIATFLTFEEVFYYGPCFLLLLAIFISSFSGFYLGSFIFLSAPWLSMGLLAFIFFFVFFIGLLSVLIISAKVFYNTYGTVSRPFKGKEKEYNKKTEVRKPHFKDVFNNLNDLWYTFKFSSWLQAADIYFDFFEKNGAKLALEKNDKTFFEKPIANALVAIKSGALDPSKYLPTTKGNVIFTCSGRKIRASISHGKASVTLNDKPAGFVDFANKEIKPINAGAWQIVQIKASSKFDVAPIKHGISIKYGEYVNRYRFEKDKNTFVEVECSPRKHFDELLDDYDSRLLFSEFSGISSINDNEKALLLVAALLTASLFIVQTVARAK